MPLMTRINGRPIMITFTPIPLTGDTEVREVFSDNHFRGPSGQHPTTAYHMAILMSWPEFGNVEVTPPIRNLDCRGPRDRVNGVSILDHAKYMNNWRDGFGEVKG